MKKTIVIVLSFFMGISLKAQLEIISNGNVGIGTSSPGGQLSLGIWNSGSAGTTSGTQLLLSGLHNSGANNGGKKLVIEGYDNDGTTVYPIYLQDENSQIDFWIKNRPSASSRPSMFFPGYVGINTSPTSSYMVNISGNVNVIGSLSFNSFISNSGYAKLKTEDNYYCTNLIPSTDNNGYIGYINKAFKYVYAYNVEEISDERKKENIQTLTGSLDKILQLRGVQYDLKEEVVFQDNLRSKIKDEKFINQVLSESKNNIGFIAQEVYKIIPNVVSHDDSTDAYAISYSRIIPVLVEAMKEQQVMIENLQKEINNLNKEKN